MLRVLFWEKGPQSPLSSQKKVIKTKMDKNHSKSLSNNCLSVIIILKTIRELYPS